MHWPSKGVQSPVAVGRGVGALAHHWYHPHAQSFIVYKAGAQPQVSESAQPRKVHKCAHCTDGEAEARGTKQPEVESGLPTGSAAPPELGTAQAGQPICSLSPDPTAHREVWSSVEEAPGSRGMSVGALGPQRGRQSPRLMSAAGSERPPAAPVLATHILYA